MDAIAAMALKPNKTPRSRRASHEASASRGSMGSRGLTSGEEDYSEEESQPPRDKGHAALVERAQAELDSAVRHVIDGLELEKAVEVGSSGAAPSVEEILEALDTLQRSANAAIELFADGSELASRKKLRAQHNLSKLKLETMRTATKMKLKQQEVRLVSEHKRELSMKIREISEGGVGQKLAEAMEAKDSLEEQVKTLNVKSGRLEETLSALNKKLSALGGAGERAEWALRTSEEERETLRKQFELCQGSLEQSKEEVKSRPIQCTTRCTVNGVSHMNKY